MLIVGVHEGYVKGMGSVDGHDERMGRGWEAWMVTMRGWEGDGNRGCSRRVCEGYGRGRKGMGGEEGSDGETGVRWPLGDRLKTKIDWLNIFHPPLVLSFPFIPSPPMALTI
jgi:hypothetical protein